MTTGQDGGERVKRGQGFLIALLLSLVLGTGPAAAADTRSGGFKQADVAKSTATARGLKRVSEDDGADPLLEPPAPRPVALPARIWPAGATCAAPPAPPLQSCHPHYRARAPPASFAP